MQNNIALLLMFFLASVPVSGVVYAVEQPLTFDDWLINFKVEAKAKGISTEVVDDALEELKPIPKVIELDKNQPEFKMTLERYLNRVISSHRVNKGRQKIKRHRAMLDQLAKKYGVQPRFLVALWGIETGYGRITGGYYVIRALVTLAYDGRRSQYFRRELLNALRIMDAGHITRANMLGSWAGAMGQTQFMPSTFMQYAVDYDNDGKKDIWKSTVDALASAANYLSKLGWRDDITWGREIQLPKTFDSALVGRKVSKTLDQWQALGVRKLGGRGLAKRQLDASIVQPDGATGRSFLVYSNYRKILKWNRSDRFAISVGLLSDQLVR